VWPQYRKNLVTTALGLQEDIVSVLASNLGIKEGNETPEAALLQRLRSLPRDKTAKELQKLHMGKLGKAPLGDVLDALYAIPRITVVESKIRHSIDHESNKSVGVLHLKIEVDQQANFKTRNAADTVTIVVVLGTVKRRLILGKSDFSVGHSNGSTLTEKYISFDWELAVANGGDDGGTVIVEILPDSIRGMDCRMLVKLR
jgi:hypothetical protein